MTRGFLCLPLLAALLLVSLTPLDQGRCAEALRHDGDLILAEDETRVIRGRVLEITGGIYVRDNATLRLENVDVRFIDADEGLWHVFKAEGNSTIVLSNVRCRVEVQLYGAARLTAADSTLYRSWYCTIHRYNHTGGGVYAYQDSQLGLDNCRIGRVVTKDSAKAEITGSAVAEVRPQALEMTLVDSTVDVHWETVEGFNGTLSLTKEDLRNADGGSVIPGSKTVFRDAHVKELWVNLIDSDITFVDSQLAYVLVYNGTRLTVSNSGVNRLYVHGEGVYVSVDRSAIEQVLSTGIGNNINLKTSRSQIGVMDLEFCNVSLEVTECTIESLRIENHWAQTAGINVSDSVIGSFTPGFGNTAPIYYRFSNVTIRDSMGFRRGVWGDSGGALITGDIHFGPGFQIDPTPVDLYALITRLYNIRVTEAYTPKIGVKLTLLRGNQTLWSGETDEDGSAAFPVRYARVFFVIPPTTPSTPKVIQVNNVTETLRLRVEGGRSSVELDVGLATDTPINVNLTRNYEYGLYTLPVILAAMGLYLVKIVRGRPRPLSPQASSL